MLRWRNGRHRISTGGLAGGSAAGVYRHAMIYVVANVLLAILNLLKNPDHLWFPWVILGWGIGLLAHGLNVYSYRWFGSRREADDSAGVAAPRAFAATNAR